MGETIGKRLLWRTQARLMNSERGGVFRTAGGCNSKLPHPLEVLDYSAERNILIQMFKEGHRDVLVHFDFATTDSQRTTLSYGCKVLHFQGHGFEDGKSGLHVIRFNSSFFVI
eukprot:gene1148-1522_t